MLKIITKGKYFLFFLFINDRAEISNRILMDKKKLIISIVGPLCVLIGLVEIMRIIALHILNHGMFIGFLIEVPVYVIGIGWTIYRYAGELQRFVPSLSNGIHSLKKQAESTPQLPGRSD